MARISALGTAVVAATTICMAMLTTSAAHNAAPQAGLQLLNPSNPHLQVFTWIEHFFHAGEGGREMVCIFRAPDNEARAPVPAVFYLCPTLQELTRDVSTADVKYAIRTAPDNRRFLAIQAKLWPKRLFQTAYNVLGRTPDAPSPRNVEPLPLDWFKVTAFVRGTNGGLQPAPFLESHVDLRRDVRTDIVDLSFPIRSDASSDQVESWMQEVELSVSMNVRGNLAFGNSPDATIVVDSKQILPNFETDTFSRPTVSFTYTAQQESRVVAALAAALKKSSVLSGAAALPSPISAYGELDLTPLAELLLQKATPAEAAAFDPGLAFESRAWTSHFHNVQAAFENATSAVGTGWDTKFFLDQRLFANTLVESWAKRRRFVSGQDEACDTAKYGSAPFRIMAWLLPSGVSAGQQHRCTSSTPMTLAYRLASIFYATVNDRLGESIRVAFKADFGLLVGVPGFGSTDRHITIMRTPVHSLHAKAIDELFSVSDGVVPLSYANYGISHTFSARLR